MNQCTAYTTHFLRCSLRARLGETHCRTHREILDRMLNGMPLNPHQCTIITHGTQCQSARVEGTVLCRRHAERVALAERQQVVSEHARRYRGTPWREAAITISTDAGIDRDMVMDVAQLVYEIEVGRHHQQAFVFINYWRWIRDGRQGNPPVDIVVVPAVVALDRAPAGPAPLPLVGGGLRDFAVDGQNVHRGEVSRQTNEAVEKLLAEPDTVKDVERVLAKVWHELPAGRIPNFSRYLETALDMNRWYYTKTCRAADDYLYRKLLHGVVSLIQRQPEEMRMELYTRLYEEARDSVGMCCEGHIARLCNVFVGFDDAFKPPVSVGEMLQMKMSAISQKDVSVETKQAEAVRVFDEYGVAAEERVAWLEALA